MTIGPGTRITDNIELVAPIAEGAMGSVWVAYHWRLQTRVAVKFVSDRLGEGTAEGLARLEREASLAAQIKSPHVVQNFDSGLTPWGAPFIVMELLEGESLGARIARGGPLGMHEAALVITHVARALTAAHEIGIVHRDIKPENIFLCRTDEGTFCKVLDFGIAKQTRLPAMGGLTTEGKLVGTPEYMAPEQVLEEGEASYQSDLWALAVSLYKALTGDLPFTGGTLGQLCLNLVGSRPAPPSTLAAGLHAGVDHWFAKALYRDPERRFSSAKEMASSFASLAFEQDTAALRSTLGSLAPPPLGTENTERQFGASYDSSPAVEVPRRLRRPLIAVLASLGVMLVVAAGVVLSTDASAALGLSRPPKLASSFGPLARLIVEAGNWVDGANLPGMGIDDEEEDDGAAQTSGDGASSTQRPARRRFGRPGGAGKARGAKPSAPADDTPPAASAGPRRRGKDELGF